MNLVDYNLLGRQECDSQGQQKCDTPSKDYNHVTVTSKDDKYVMLTSKDDNSVTQISRITPVWRNLQG